MAALTDEQLLLISNLLHVKKEKDFQTGFFTEQNAAKQLTIGEMLEKLLADDTLEKLKADTSGDLYDGEISAQEWATMLEHIKEDDQLCSMTLQVYERDANGGVSICLTDAENNAYVAFRGTGGGDWYDNFEGAYVADTEQQRRALSFVNNLSYDNITVIGHSKGGNKSKYVALLSDKVSRCVSFDGQGFSRDFYEKYGDLIEKNKWKISNYALSGDFVNILLYDIDYEHKIYVKGHGVDDFKENHSPNSLFNESFEFDIVAQNPEMETLHKFVVYVLNTISDEDREILFPFLGQLAEYMLGKRPPEYTEPYNLTQEEILEYLFCVDNADAMGILLAYIVKYEEIDNAIVDVICAVLKETGITGMGIAVIIDTLDKNIGLEKIVKEIVTDAWILQKIFDLFGMKSDSFPLGRIAEAAAKRYVSLPSKYINSGEYRTNNTRRDFTESMRNYLIGLCNEVDSEPWYDVTKWDVWYRAERLVGHLRIDNYVNNINSYYRKMIDINDSDRKAINKIFNDVEETDRRYAQKIRVKNARLQELRDTIEKLEIPG